MRENRNTRPLMDSGYRIGVNSRVRMNIMSGVTMVQPLEDHQCTKLAIHFPPLNETQREQNARFYAHYYTIP